MSALALANTTRLYRAELKREIKAGHVNVCDVLRDPDPLVRRMPVVELLMALPHVAASTAERILRQSGTAPNRTVIGLTWRQVEAICALLERPRAGERRVA